MSDSDLRQALLGTWRLVDLQAVVDGTLVKPLGDHPLGYLVYTPDDHMFVQFATRAERTWPGPEILELSNAAVRDALGFAAYCGTFPRSVVLDQYQAAIGRRTVKHVRPGRESTETSPRCPSTTIRLTMSRPKPVPFPASLVV